MADLEKTMSRQRADMSRVNTMLAETTEAQAELASETFCLRRDLDNQLKVPFIHCRLCTEALRAYHILAV